MFGFKKGETIYSINLIPFGGFVRLFGEEEDKSNYLQDSRSFKAQSKKVRALVISAGIIVNFLTAVLIFYFLLPFNNFSSYQYLISDYRFPFRKQKNFLTISYISKNSPADKAGLEIGDIILNINGQEFSKPEDLILFINQNKGQEVKINIKKFQKDEAKEIKVVPRINAPEGEGSLGVGINVVSNLFYNSFLEKTSVGFLHSFNLMHYSVSALGYLIKSSWQEKSIKPLSSGVVGPVGIVAVTSIVAKEGLIAILNLTALIALALVIMNILPFPALDGGQLFLIGIEAVFKKRIPLKVEKTINFIGFIFLVFLLILVTAKDISQFKNFFIK